MLPLKRPKIVYPSYFDSRLSRTEGRRVSRNLSIRRPNLQRIIRVLKYLSLDFEVEDDKHRPSRWYKVEGRVKIYYEGSKEELLKNLGKALRSLRE